LVYSLAFIDYYLRFQKLGTGFDLHGNIQINCLKIARQYRFILFFEILDKGEHGMGATLNESNLIKYYCFNKDCEISIFNSDTCIVTEVSLAKNLGESVFCRECYKELVSKPDLNIKIQLAQLLNEKKQYKSLIIDDDPDYHSYANELFKNSSTFNELKHYTDGNVAISYLEDNKSKANVIPDFIFVDANMPKMNAWEFLDEFEPISPFIKKEINIYVISNKILPEYKEKLKSRPYVKGIITKNFDLSFLNNVSL